MKIVEYLKTSNIGKLFFFLFLLVLGSIVIGIFGLMVHNDSFVRIGTTVPFLTLFFLFPFTFEFLRSIRDFDTRHRWVIRIHDRERRYTACFQDDFYVDLEHSVFKVSEFGKWKNVDKQLSEKVDRLVEKAGRVAKPKGDIYAVIGKKYCFLSNILSIEKTNLLFGFGQNLVVRGDSRQFDINTGIAYSFYPDEVIKGGQVLGDTLKRLAELKEELSTSVPQSSIEAIKATINYYDRGLREARIAVGKTQPSKYILAEKENVQVNSWVKWLIICALIAVGAIGVFLFLG